MKKLFTCLTPFEIVLWAGSVIAIVLSTVLSGEPDYFAMTASLFGVTSLIYIAKGMPVGQMLMLVFATFYAMISFEKAYYGEMVTYMGMTLPMAVISMISWLKNPYDKSGEVKVNRLSFKMLLVVALTTLGVTAVFYFILKALNTANLLISTFSVATSFFAVFLTFLRSPLYALGYVANDVVIILLWILAAIEDPGAYSVVVCFAVFFVNDLYGFINWRKIDKRQRENPATPSDREEKNNGAKDEKNR